MQNVKCTGVGSRSCMPSEAQTHAQVLGSKWAAKGAWDVQTQCVKQYASMLVLLCMCASMWRFWASNVHKHARGFFTYDHILHFSASL